MDDPIIKPGMVIGRDYFLQVKWGYPFKDFGFRPRHLMKVYIIKVDGE